jgi:Fe-S oxidoreductase
MTITYDPNDPTYLDEAAVRSEMTRVFDVCHGCRLCFQHCTAFPSLFEMIDRHDDRDAGRLTPAQQDRVVDECFQCSQCFMTCPYVPGRHELSIDFPRLMLRARAMRRATKQLPLRDRRTTQLVARTDLIGTVAAKAPIVNTLAGAKPGGVVRKVVESVTGVSAVRVLPPFTRQRFTTWFKRRPKVRIGKQQGRVTVMPTCLVEYQAPEIGHDLVKVYERNGIEVTVADAGCCGAPWLHAGDNAKFTKIAEKNVKVLAEAVGAGRDIVVPQPECADVIKREYAAYAPGADTILVVQHTYDTAEYLMKVHRGEDTHLDTQFDGDVPAKITYHTPCHLRAQGIGLKSRDLMRLTGARIKIVQQCAGMNAMWGVRAANSEIAVPVAVKLAEAVTRAGGDVVTGDCHLANAAIAEQTGAAPLHPLQVLARAYGIRAEETA